MRRSGDDLTLVIEENGRGFSPVKTEPMTSKSGAGLTGMEQRAHLIGGKILLRSAAGQGTIVTVNVSNRGFEYE